FLPNNDGLFDDNARHKYSNQNWGYVDPNKSLKNEGGNDYEVLAAKPRGRFSCPKAMNRRNNGANERPLMLEKGNYIPWESRFRRFLDNKLEDGERMQHSIKKGPYVRPMIPDPDDTREQIIKPLLTKINKKQYIADDGRVDIQTKNARYGENCNMNAGRQNRNQAFNAGNRLTQNEESNQIVQLVPRTKSNPGNTIVHCYNCNEKCDYARDCQKPRVSDAKYFREKMLLAMKDKARSNIKDKENDFMLDNSYRDETLDVTPQPVRVEVLQI
nr:hypothetical protein [Tanacetum cinerariifolium]